MAYIIVSLVECNQFWEFVFRILRFQIVMAEPNYRFISARHDKDSEKRSKSKLLYNLENKCLYVYRKKTTNKYGVLVSKNS